MNISDMATYPDVITNVQMEELAPRGKIKRPSDGKEVTTVAFIDAASPEAEHPLAVLFVGQRRLVALKQAQYVRKSNPEGKAYIFYENMRTPGQYEIFYQAMQDDPGVFLSKGHSGSGIQRIGEALAVELKDTSAW